MSTPVWRATVCGVKGVLVLADGDNAKVYLSAETVAGWNFHDASRVTDLEPCVVLRRSDLLPDGITADNLRHFARYPVELRRDAVVHTLADALDEQAPAPPRMPEPPRYTPVTASLVSGQRREWVRMSDDMWHDQRGTQASWDVLVDPQPVGDVQ